MAKQDSIYKAILIIQEALERKTTVNTICLEEFDGTCRNYVANAKLSIKEKREQGTISPELYDEFMYWWGLYEQKKSSFVRYLADDSIKHKPITEEQINEFREKFENPEETPEEKQNEKPKEKVEKAEYDSEADEEFDKRSISKVIKDDDGKITKYYYKIYIRGDAPLEGHFSREEMNKIYRLYSNLDGAALTQRALTREFPTLTFRDIKRILKAFNITKQSIPVAPHIIDEMSNEEVAKVIFLNKENNYLKYIDQNRSREIEKLYKKKVEEVANLKNNVEIIKQIVKDIIIADDEPFKIEIKDIDNERALFVFLADEHVGADTPDESLYKNTYNEKEYNRRLTCVLERIKSKYAVLGRFDAVFICSMGDSLDGYNELTTRGGHRLSQNLTNKEQFNVYINGMKRFFDTLHEMDVANKLEYQCVSDDNHSGDFGYFANRVLQEYFVSRYPDMKVVIFDKFIQHLVYGNHTFILTHGKDKEDRRSGFPLNLDTKTEAFFGNYIDVHRIMSPYISVVKADLHQTSVNHGKRFRYKNVSSMYGSSKWIQNNFGYTQAATDFEIVEKFQDEILEGRITF